MRAAVQQLHQKPAAAHPHPPASCGRAHTPACACRSSSMASSLSCGRGGERGESTGGEEGRVMRGAASACCCRGRLPIGSSQQQAAAAAGPSSRLHRVQLLVRPFAAQHALQLVPAGPPQAAHVSMSREGAGSDRGGRWERQQLPLPERAHLHSSSCVCSALVSSAMPSALSVSSSIRSALSWVGLRRAWCGAF